VIVARVHPVWRDEQPQQPFDVSHLSSLTLLHIDSSWMQGDVFPSSLREVTWELWSGRRIAGADACIAGMSLQPLLQPGALEKLHFVFDDVQPALIQHELLHKMVAEPQFIWNDKRVWHTRLALQAQLGRVMLLVMGSRMLLRLPGVLRL
jgi:hypothetical protein